MRPSTNVRQGPRRRRAPTLFAVPALPKCCGAASREALPDRLFHDSVEGEIAGCCNALRSTFASRPAASAGKPCAAVAGTLRRLRSHQRHHPHDKSRPPIVAQRIYDHQRYVIPAPHHRLTEFTKPRSHPMPDATDNRRPPDHRLTRERPSDRSGRALRSGCRTACARISDSRSGWLT